MRYEAQQPQERYDKDEPVEAYGMEWLVSDVDHKGRYTLRFDHWAIYAVDPILVTRKRN